MNFPNIPIIYEFGKATPHFFLSNFYPCEIVVPSDPSVVYPTAEHAYQAWKTEVASEKLAIRNAISPGAAKSFGRHKVSLRKGWDGMKVGVMAQLLEIKFRHPALRQMLVETAPKMLLEGNYWHDTFYGVCLCTTHRGKVQTNSASFL